MAKEDKEYNYDPKPKRKINYKGISAICLILLVMITLTFIIGGKAYKIEVLDNGHINKTGDPPTSLMQILQYCQSVPDVGLQNTLKTIVTTINGTNATIERMRATTPNWSNFEQYLYSAFQIIINIIWLPIVFIVQIVAFIGWVFGAIFVL